MSGWGPKPNSSSFKEKERKKIMQVANWANQETLQIFLKGLPIFFPCVNSFLALLTNV
jgi:hypothetical protein